MLNALIRRRIGPFIALVILSVGLPVAAMAQSQSTDGNGNGNGDGDGNGGFSALEARELTQGGFPIALAQRVAQAPLVDGDVLADTAYEDAREATGFVQSRPFEGQPASERTEVRIVYTEDTLYFGIVCYTADPSTIIVADSRRD